MNKSLLLVFIAIFLAACSPGKPIVFVGDSLTARANWSDLLQTTIVNKGISGDTTQGVLARIDDVVSSKPDKLFIMIGTNDLYYKIPDTIKNYDKILSSIQGKTPSTLIYVQSVLPSDFEGRTILEIENLNNQLMILCRKHNVIFINLYPLFKDGQGIRKTLTVDGLHLNDNGYKIWANAIKYYVLMQ